MGYWGFRCPNRRHFLWEECCYCSWVETKGAVPRRMTARSTRVQYASWRVDFGLRTEKVRLPRANPGSTLVYNDPAYVMGGQDLYSDRRSGLRSEINLGEPVVRFHWLYRNLTCLHMCRK